MLNLGLNRLLEKGALVGAQRRGHNAFRRLVAATPSRQQRTTELHRLMVARILFQPPQLHLASPVQDSRLPKGSLCSRVQPVVVRVLLFIIRGARSDPPSSLSRLSALVLLPATSAKLASSVVLLLWSSAEDRNPQFYSCPGS